MQRVALVLALVAIAAAVASPYPFIAIGCGIAAWGTGKIVYGRRSNSGPSRLAGAAAMTVGLVGCLLGVVRVAFVVAAIVHIERMIGA